MKQELLWFKFWSHSVGLY